MLFLWIAGSAREAAGPDAPLSIADSGAGAAPDAVGAALLAARAAVAEVAAAAALGGASSGVGSVVAAVSSAWIDVPAKPAVVCADAEPAGATAEDADGAFAETATTGSPEPMVAAC